MFNLPQDKLHNVEAGIGTQEGSLPFAAPVFYVVNGKANTGSEIPALKFGGWATDAEKMDQILQQENRELPPNLKKTTMTTAENKTIEVYTARALVVTIACFRSSWLAKDNKSRSNEYKENTRRHVQALAAMAVPNKSNSFDIWGPVVLSSKGFQAKKLLATMDDWSKHTAVIRSQLAPGVPSFMFYCAVGTFGDQPVFEMVGSGNARSPITPLSLNKPELTQEKLQRIYGGEKLLETLTKIQEDSKQWMSAWNVSSKVVDSNESLPVEDGDEFPY